MRKIDTWQRKHKRELDDLKAAVSNGKTPVSIIGKTNRKTNRASMQEYEKPNVIFTKSSKSMNFGKNAPWNVLKANNLFTTKPKTQPIAKQLKLQGNNFFVNLYLQKQIYSDLMKHDDVNIKGELINSIIKLKLKNLQKIGLASKISSF